MGWNHLEAVNKNDGGLKPSVVSYYLDSGFSVQEVAKQLCCRKQRIYDVMREHGLKAKRRKAPCQFATYSDFYEHFVIEGGGVRTFAEKMGVAPSTVSRWKKEFKIAQAVDRMRFVNTDPDVNNKEWLSWAYQVNTQQEIAKMANTSQQIVSDKMILYGIDTTHDRINTADRG
jgi:transposase